MIKGILFDFDGTLVDTNPLILRTLRETFAALLPDQVMTEQEILDCIGPTLDETGRKYFPDNPDSFITHYRKLNLAYHDDMIEIYPGVIEMLEELQHRGLRLAIVSSKKRDVVLRGLQLMNLEHYFDFILGGDEVTNPKPHHEPIEVALEALGLQPEEAMMVGDNSHDIHSAQNAGVISVGVGWALKGAAYLATFNPTHLIATPCQLLNVIDEKRSDFAQSCFS